MKKHFSNLEAEFYFIYGKHAVLSALQNPVRVVKRLFITESNAERHRSLIVRDSFDIKIFKNLEKMMQQIRSDSFFQSLEPKLRSALLTANNQGFMLLVAPLMHKSLVETLKDLDVIDNRIDQLEGGVLGKRNQGNEGGEKSVDSKSIDAEGALRMQRAGGMMHSKKMRRIFVMLDGIVDPHNVGAILRSAAVFGIDSVILAKSRSPSENATIAKIASGGLDRVNINRVSNLVGAVKILKKAGYWVFGMDGTARDGIGDVMNGYDKNNAMKYERILLILGGEEKGISPLIRKSCDFLLKIPILLKGVIDASRGDVLRNFNNVNDPNTLEGHENLDLDLKNSTLAVKGYRSYSYGGLESLNVSNAAAIAMYEAAKVNFGF